MRLTFRGLVPAGVLMTGLMASMTAAAAPAAATATATATAPAFSERGNRADNQASGHEDRNEHQGCNSFHGLHIALLALEGSFMRGRINRTHPLWHTTTSLRLPFLSQHI